MLAVIPLLHLVAQEVDVSKWGSTIVSAIIGITVIATMRESLASLKERFGKIESKVDAIHAEHTATRITVAEIKATVEATGEPTGRFPRGGK